MQITYLCVASSKYKAYEVHKRYIYISYGHIYFNVLKLYKISESS